MKSTLLKIATILTFALAIMSCSKDDESSAPAPLQAPVSDVFAAGFENSSTIQYFFYKNNTRSSMSAAADEFVAIAGILVDGNEVYVTGKVITAPFPADNRSQPCYWKNNVKVNLPLPPTSSNYVGANEIAILNGDVYVLGLDPSFPQNFILWKNGVRSSYASVPAGSSLKGKSLCVFGNDVYVAGSIDVGNDGSNIRATYWKNGIATTVGTSKSFCNDIKVDQTGVHIVYVDYTGLDNITAIKYWKDGANTTISTLRPAVGKMLVKGTDVYITGAEREVGSSIFKACYWKNGVKTDLNENTNLIANNIKIGVNGDIFVSSRRANNGDAPLTYWQNNIKKTIGNSNDNFSCFDINNK